MRNALGLVVAAIAADDREVLSAGTRKSGARCGGLGIASDRRPRLAAVGK